MHRKNVFDVVEKEMGTTLLQACPGSTQEAEK